MVPLWFKILYTLFLCVLVPCYWRQYGLRNFLWFSDIALLVTLAGLWLESRFLISMQAVSVLLLEWLWCVDFVLGLVAGKPAIGLSKYMFSSRIPVFVRALSLFHLWLPWLLLWLVWQLGYDERAWLAQSVAAEIVLLVCYFLTRPADNINWAFGMGSKTRKRMSCRVYLVLVMMTFPLGIYLPTHLFLERLFSG